MKKLIYSTTVDDAIQACGLTALAAIVLGLPFAIFLRDVLGVI